MEDEERNKKLAQAQQKIEALLAKEFPGEKTAFWLFAAKPEGNNIKVSFSSRMSFDKSASLAVWQAFASGVQTFAQGVLNDYKPPELVFAQPKHADRATG